PMKTTPLPRTSSVSRSRAATAERLAAFDEALRKEAGGLIVGVDEAGRGPLAGPVVAAAVVFPTGLSLEGVNDSKKLTEEEREAARERIEGAALGIGVGVVGPRTIDSINILQATHLAARQALEAINCPFVLLMTDFLKLDFRGLPVRAEAKADGMSLSVAAASIIAKTTRDRMMAAYADEYPGYFFERHKGYASPEHLERLERLGPCTLHRFSFNGVSWFSELARPSRSFARLAALREAGDGGAFREEAEQTLARTDRPLVECEHRQVRCWLFGGASAASLEALR
ncbi:MAG: ribonuclease HII, partial [Candidatus Sumerlaeota bacterium]|nr:ribonuclease HII [Candidatus Sumerlaeota bacterium]